VFEVHDTIEGEDKSPVQQRLAEVERVAMALSLRNGLGFHLLEHSLHPLFVGQQLGIILGLEVRLPTSPEPESCKLVAELQAEPRRYAAATAFQHSECSCR
jgi:hypothetical protein